MRKSVLPFTRLRKQEFAAFASSVIEITEKHNPETLKLSETFNLLKRFEPQISMLTPDENDINGEVSYTPARMELKTYVSALLHAVKGTYECRAKTRDDNSELAYQVVKAKLSGFSKKNMMAQNETVHQLLSQIDSTPTVKDALTALNCMEYIEHLREIHLEFMELYDFERHKRSNRVQNENMIIKKELQIKIEDFFQNLYLAKKINPNINYQPIESELNVEIQRVRSILAIRRAASIRRLEQRSSRAV